MQIMAILFLLTIMLLSLHTIHANKGGWQKAHATFYGGEDASGTMGTFSCICIYIVHMILCLLEP